MAEAKRSLAYVEQRITLPSWFCRWHVFIASLLFTCTLGQSGCFSLYSSDLKTNLGYSQTDVDWLGVAKNAAIVYAVFLGGLYDQYGAFFLNIIGGLTAMLTFGLIWAAVEGYIDVSYLTMWWLHFFAYGATQGLEVCPLIVCMVNFPKHKTWVSSLLLSGSGLSSAFFSQYDSLKHDGSVILLCGLIPGITCLLTWPFMRMYPDATYSAAEIKATKSTMYYFLAAMSLNICYMTAIDIGQVEVDFNYDGFAASIAGYVCLIGMTIAGGVAFWRWALDNEVQKEEAVEDDQKGIADQAEASVNLYDTFAAPEPKTKRKTIEWQEGDTPYWKLVLALVTDWRYPLLVVGTYLSAGSVTMATDNITQIALAIVGIQNTDRITRYTTTLQVSMAAGRLAGIPVAMLLARFKTPRVVLMMVGYALLCLGLYFYAETSEDKLYMACTFQTFGYGLASSILGAVIVDIWGETTYGVSYMGVIFATNFLGSLVGSIVFFVEEYNDTAQIEIDGTKYCFGNECFDATFYAMLWFSIIGILLYCIFTYATWEEHTKVLEKNLEEKPAPNVKLPVIGSQSAGART
ncbi:hypothetical protein CYMTET_51751 [Cymbomonas tetramitiformis]|uniref:Nodulin-like domain-containing protein n=1 Tax=Cymbomonas tetramitiformis TaxID=36881 RepID=A0AAE0BKM3_9CHLO|nr:hypothetical protein CYMTET_51751 [Cymbomonas tetramitiformis]